MLPGNELAVQIAAYATALAAAGHLLLRIDAFAHGPAALKAEIDAINKRLERGNEEMSKGMSRVMVKMEQIDAHLNAVDSRVSYLEGRDSHNDTPRPRNR